MENNLWQNLYSNHPDRYDRLVQAEDYRGYLIAALRELNRMDNSTVVELGAGTGRITTQLLPYIRHICAFDLTPAMIHLAHQRLKQSAFRQIGRYCHRRLEFHSDYDLAHGKLATRSWTGNQGDVANCSPGRCSDLDLNTGHWRNQTQSAGAIPGSL